MFRIMKFVSLTLIVLLCHSMAVNAQVPSSHTQSKADCVLGISLSTTKVGRGLQMATTVSNADNAIAGLSKIHSFLATDAKDKIKACGISLQGALQRCEAAHGSGNCETDAMYAQKKCPTGLARIGCCTCAPACPTGFDEKTLFCIKPAADKSAQYNTQAECENLSKKTCEQWVLDFWVPRCTSGFVRVGSDQCIAMCPEGWKDTSRHCHKPTTVQLGAPFVWQSRDN